eukprot:Plantae.Rhodophyta-Purpureofilum_apyrenoidigerum.ctg831.p2 GENE.Plantae.Rhodophyta-Purpureofilum_apyrenoidigerum.ctg831~~Plantae.Rhodophyta-Purpureofilum_apyrenoidigerum.ctg831.p2  ORF type:complete len:146 (+),score=9.55 Plantae.Rhodophyta-Purpureofilum_apyrenoidigerum.ctg831:676-1113(+)
MANLVCSAKLRSISSVHSLSRKAVAKCRRCETNDSCSRLRLLRYTDHETYLIAIANYAGNLMVYFFGDPILRSLHSVRFGGKEGRLSKPRKFSLRSLFHPERRKLFVLAVNELISFACGFMGLSLAGSGLYQVVLSGTTVRKLPI